MADANDLNRDGRVTRDEIDRVAGDSPGYFAKKPEGSGFLGGAMNLAGNALRVLPLPSNIGYGLVDRQARKDDWAVRRDTLYKQYGITPAQAPAVPGTAPAAGAQGAPGAVPQVQRPKSGFDTLGVNQGLIDLGVVREQMDPTGNIVYVTPRRGGESMAMQYKAQDAVMLLGEMDEQQLMNFRRAMYISGYGTPRKWAGPVSKQDIDLMAEAMTDANFAGATWDEVVNRRVETGGRYARPLTMYEAAINAGDTASVLKQYAQRNGIVLSDSFIANQQRAVADGQIQMDDLLTLIKETYVKTLYPAFANEIDMGLTIEDLAGPWRGYLAETFGVDEGDISLYDPLLQAALQNFDPHGQPTKTAMNDFADMVQADPRWEYSPDAWNKIGYAADQLASTFGLNTQYKSPSLTYGGGPEEGGYRG